MQVIWIIFIAAVSVLILAFAYKVARAKGRAGMVFRGLKVWTSEPRQAPMIDARDGSGNKIVGNVFVKGESQGIVDISGSDNTEVIDNIVTDQLPKDRREQLFVKTIDFSGTIEGIGVVSESVHLGSGGKLIDSSLRVVPASGSINMKTLKFKTHLAEMILRGEKTTTWRLFDDKDLRVGDRLQFINSDTGEEFAQGDVHTVYQKTFSTLEPDDFQGHETYANDEEMYATFRGYHGDVVGPDTVVKIVRYHVIKQ